MKKKENFVKSLKANLDKVDLNNLDPNYLMDKILLATKDAIDQNFPYKKVTRKEAKLILNPWMTKEILKERKIRDDLKMKFCKHKIVNSEDHINYKRYRNKVRIMIRDARRKYTLNDCKKAKGSSKKMWKVIKKATNDNPKPSIIPDFVKTKTTNGETRTIKSKKEIANVMNRQFSEMGAKLAEKLDQTDASIFDYLKKT